MNTLQQRMDFLFSLRQGSLANLYQVSDKCAELEMKGSSGLNSLRPSAFLDRDSGCLKTCPDFSALARPELAYAAGIIDGEGCITIYTAKRKSGNIYTAAVMIGMGAKGQPIVNWMQKQFGGSIYSYQKRKQEHADQISWRLHGLKAIAFLKEIQPGLILKRKQCETVIALEQWLPKKWAWTDEGRGEAEKLKARIQHLNAKGNPPPIWVTGQQNLDGSLEEFSGTWSQSGMIAGGMYFPLPRLVQGISASASSLSLGTPTAAMKVRSPQFQQGTVLNPLEAARLLPTPRASAIESRQTKVTPSQEAGTHGASLQASVIAKLLPTPTTRDYKDTPGMAREVVTAGDVTRTRDDQLPRRIYADGSVASAMASRGGMRLTPEFLCWLMGYPPNWLKPLRDALAMR